MCLRIPCLLLRFLAFVPDVSGSASLASKTEELLPFTVNPTLSCLPIETLSNVLAFPACRMAFLSVKSWHIVFSAPRMV